MSAMGVMRPSGQQQCRKPPAVSRFDAVYTLEYRRDSAAYEWYTRTPLKHLASRKIEVSRWTIDKRTSSIRECEIKRSARHWINIGRHPMPTILKRSTASITRTRCWNTRNQASEPVVDEIGRASAPASQAKSGLRSDESLAAVTFGSPNSP